MPNPKSTASIAGHPIHPMLVPFPIAFFIGALACDLAFWKNANVVWFTASEWLLGAGLVMAVLAAIAGLTDFSTERPIRNINAAWWHAGGNILVVLIEAYNLYMRYTTGLNSVLYTGLVLSVISAVILGVTAWLGGEMVYRHGVGVTDRTEDRLNGRRHGVKDDGRFYPQDKKPGSRPENMLH